MKEWQADTDNGTYFVTFDGHELKVVDYDVDKGKISVGQEEPRRARERPFPEILDLHVESD